MSSNQPPIFDMKFVIIMVFAFSAWMGWQSYLAKKYPDAYKNKTKVENVVNPAGENAANSGESKVAEQDKEINQVVETKSESKSEVPESVLNYEDDVWSFQVSSKGMGLKNIHLKKYNDRAHQPISFASAQGTSLFSTYLTGYKEPLHFEISKASDGQLVGIANFKGMKITKKIDVSSTNYSFNTTIKVENVKSDFDGLITQFSDKTTVSSGSMFSGSRFDSHEFYVSHESKETRVAIKEEAHMESFPQTLVAGLSSQYFATAILDNSSVIPDFKAKMYFAPKVEEQEKADLIAQGQFMYGVLDKEETNYKISYTAYAGPKSIEILKEVNPSLAPLVNLGFFTFFAKKILWLMNTIQAAVGIWGFNIILLTILV